MTTEETMTSENRRRRALSYAAAVALVLTAGCSKREATTDKAGNTAPSSTNGSAATAAAPLVPATMRGVWQRRGGGGQLTITASGIAGEDSRKQSYSVVAQVTVAITAARSDGSSYIVDDGEASGNVVNLGEKRCKGNLELSNDQLNVTMSGHEACSNVMSGTFIREAVAAKASSVPASATPVLNALKGRVAVKVRKWNTCKADSAPWKPTKGFIKLTPSNESNTAGSIEFLESNQVADYVFSDFSNDAADWTISHDGKKLYTQRVRFAGGELQVDQYHSNCADVSLVPASD